MGGALGLRFSGKLLSLPEICREFHLFWPIRRQESYFGMLTDIRWRATQNQQYSQPPTYSRLTRQEPHQNVTELPQNYSKLHRNLTPGINNISDPHSQRL